MGPAIALTIAVAASVQPALEELTRAFTAEENIPAQLVPGASGALAAQARAGAPFDLFVSADREYPDALRRDGFAEAPRVYACGGLALWTAKDLDPTRGLRLLAEPAVKRAAIADPRVAPYGRAALGALERAGLRAAVEPKLVYGESVAQANQFILSGAADAGITARAAVLAPQAKGKGRWAEVDGTLYAPVPQALAVLERGRGRSDGAAERFARFMGSAAARRVLERHGYRVPGAPGCPR